MALNLTVLLLVLAITFMHAIFGFFSGLINLFCTVAAVAVSLGFYDALNDAVTANFAGEYTAYTEPLCLFALFVFTLAILRTLADNYIRGNVKLPAAVDWIGSSICGVINAQLFVGVLVISVTMLPLGGRVMGYSAWERSEYDEQDPDHSGLHLYERQHLWVRSDEFTAGLFNLLSSGSLRGVTTIASVYPDFCESIYFSTNTVQVESSPAAYRSERGQSRDGWKQGLRIEGWWEETGPVETRYRPELPTARQPKTNFERVELKPAPGKKWFIAQLALDASGADRKDRTPLHLFRPTMIRLVGSVAGDTPVHYVPRILANTDPDLQGGQRAVDLDTNVSLPGDAPARIYAYYEVDQDFRPAFVEYRRHARAAVAPNPTENPQVVLTLAGEDSGGGRSQNRTFRTILENGSGIGARLPFAMNRQALQGAGDITLSDGRVASGRAFGSLSRLQAQEGETPVEDFLVPADRRMLQIRYKPREAQSIVGQVFNYVGQLNQYYAVDNNAERHEMVGYYAIVKRGNEQYIELYYAGGAEIAESAANRAMLDFKNFERNEINDLEDSVVGMLFLVPTGREIVKIVNNQGGEVEVGYSTGG